MSTHPSNDEYRKMAMSDCCGSDDIQIDADALVSQEEDGAWVQCWLWVPNPEPEDDEIDNPFNYGEMANKHS